MPTKKSKTKKPVKRTSKKKPVKKTAGKAVKKPAKSRQQKSRRDPARTTVTAGKKVVAKKTTATKTVTKRPLTSVSKKRLPTAKKVSSKKAVVTKSVLTKKEAIEKAEMLKRDIEIPTWTAPPTPNSKTEFKIALRTDEQPPMSPYTIFLSRDIPTPQQLIQTEELRSLSGNLLHQYALAEALEQFSTDPDELRILENDLRHQMKESDLTNFVMPFWARLPRLPKFQKSSKVRTGSTWSPSTYRTVSEPEPVAELPKTKPVDIFAMLEFPEEDEEVQTTIEPETEEVALPEFIMNADGTADIVEIAIAEAAEERLVQPEPKTRTKKRLSLNIKLEQGWHRALATFVMLSFSFVLPLHAMDSFSSFDQAKAEAENSSQAALNDLQSATGSIMSADFKGASNDFARASTEFQKAEDTLEGLRSSVGIIVSLIPATSRTYQSGSELLKAGDTLSRAASRISDAFSAMQNEINPTPVSKIEILEKTLIYTIPLLEEAQAHLDNVNPELIPAEARPTFESLNATLPTLTNSLEEFMSFAEVAKTILGNEQRQRYLVVFQNNMELRPTGGFIGSYAEIDIYQGEITKVHVPAGGSYDLQGSNRKYIAAPEQLQLINARWEFQDANWFPDFPTSAKKLTEFYEQSGGPSVDGVIAVNATYVADLLALIGPVEMADYNRTFDSENFIFETQKIVEIEAERQAPKQLIGDLAPVLLDQIKDSDAEDFLEVLGHLGDGLANKDLQLYFTDSETQQQINDWGWAGDVKMVAGDYFMLVTTNIGGGKTDGIIKESVDVVVEISDDGTITNEVTITRTHPGIENDLFVGVNNVDYMRLFVPRGSQLLSASGFEIPESELFERPAAFFEEDQDLSYTNINTFVDPISGTVVTEEFGKTVYGNWIQTKPGETEIARFVYELPWKVQVLTNEYDLVDKVKDYFGLHPVDSYTMFIQKQSGVSDRTINLDIKIPELLNPIWSTNDIQDQSIKAKINQDEEIFLGIVFENDL